MQYSGPFIYTKWLLSWNKDILLMLSKCLSLSTRTIATYGFATQKIKVKNPVAELDGD
jgi:hypothetical protein